MIELTSHLMLALRSRRNGFNGLVKFTLLHLTGVEDQYQWPKYVLGKKISKSYYYALQKHKNVHLDDITKYKELVKKMHEMQDAPAQSWNND